ncbi:hypothetical protein NAEGRDRAFT_80793 [Naegleria gruberi]|uniref:Uncharacterized protein n=1 Tax=Naegleria gruberi TaxID=5762 RepID=D2VPV9_NAEGR|nr:uncharacterized protein NAEGRDRAFT_80793 [Naegleria gruberi]EFC41194.1 hypothetical protein NAEGRDRAFT_80793 [Naegleria gruberi]|eukprot:XP_002673938.1 hypothetical protein NAEGRDRAFT_80793 [Naegleria gruberi strain NEG-M]
MNNNNATNNNHVHPYMMAQQQQQQFTKSPDAPPIQYHSGLAQQQQQPVFTTSSPYPTSTTTTTYTTTIESVPQQYPTNMDNVAQASMEDSSLKLVGTSIAKQMWTKLKSRVRSPYTLVSSLCNMLSLAMLFEFIFIIVASCQYYNATPAHMHIVFWILFVVQPIFMILKSPLLMVVSLFMNLAMFVMSCVQTAAYGKNTGISYGVLVVMFLYSCFFSVILAISYLKKVNKSTEQQATQSPKAAIMADIVTITQNIKRYREMIKACKISDLLIGAE